jgi:hypothetical protein
MTPNAGSIFWDNDTVRSAVANLHRDNLIEIFSTKRATGTTIDGVAEVSGQALREVGAWPSPDSTADRLIAALQQIADNTVDPETRTRARKILEGFAGSCRQIAVGVAAALTTGAIQ